MADQQNIKLQDRQYRLYKEIQVKFRESVDPLPLSYYLFATCLTEDDMDRIKAKYQNDGRSKAAGELLDRLRRRPNWVYNLLLACSHPELDLDHLCSYIMDKMNLGSINDASEEVLTQQGRGLKSVIETILADFKSRVDPEDFIPYLTRLEEEDEEAVKCKQQQSGKRAAAEELVSRLLRKYEHWKDDLQEALIYPESGLKDLGEKLSEIDEQDLQAGIERVMAENTTENMLDTLMKGDPSGFKCLFDAFVETHNKECAKKLAPYILAQEKHALKKEPSEWPPLYKEHFDMMKEPVTYLKPNDSCCFLQYNNTEEVYSMRRECRGLVYLINNEQFQTLSWREGTKFDRNNLKKLFTDLHFEVIVEDDLTAEEIRKNTESISKCDKMKDSDCFIFIILTHGDEKGVCGIDGVSVPVTTLTEMFEPNNCPELNEKPKIFLIQACRGDKTEMVCSSEGPGENRSQGDGGGDQVDGMNASDINVKREPYIYATQTVHSKSDILVAYSTPEGSLSWRKMDAGSWFMQAIVWIFKFESHVKDLVEMLGKVNNIVSKGKTGDVGSHFVTVSKYESSLRKKLFFFPGIYGDKRVHPQCI